MRLTILTLTYLLTHVCMAQLHVTAKPTGKHEQFINQSNYVKRGFDKIKSVKKDSIDAIRTDTALTNKEKRKRVRQLKQRWRSEKARGKMMARQELEERAGFSLPDTIPYPPKTPDDSLKWAMQVLASNGQYEDIQIAYERYQSVDSLSADSLGYLSAQKSAQIAEGFLPEDLKSTLSDDIPAPDPGQMLMSDIPDTELPHLSIDNLVSEMPSAKMDDAVSSLTNLKKKYTTLPDIRDLKGGVKKNSLKGQSLARRLVLGGNISLISTDPIISDINVQLGFKVNSKYTIGAGLMWRESFADGDSVNQKSQLDSHGFSGYMSYLLFKTFFAYAEYGAVIEESLFARTTVEREAHWQYQYLLGIGSEIPIFKYGNALVIIAYDFNHRNNNTHPRPFVVRVGFSLTSVPWKK